MDVRRFGAHYRSPPYTLERAREVYETYYDIKYPGHERQAGRPLRRLAAPTTGTASTARRSARSRAGSGSTTTRRNAPAGDEALRPRGWAGLHWSPAIGAEHRGHAASAPRCSTRRRSPRSRSAGPGAADLLERLCDNRVARERRPDHLHADAQRARRDRVRLHRHAARGGAASDRHRHRLRRPRPGLDPPPRAGDGGVRVRDVTALGLLRACGGRGHATCCGR